MERDMNRPEWNITVGDSPLVATAIHDGHEVRPEVAQWMALPEPERLREEDPFTASWTAVAPTRIVGRRSRFEVDLNRPREKAVYRRPEDAWGLKVWRDELPEDIVERSLEIYDTFYAEVREVLQDLERRFGRFVVFDLHTYNHRRDGADQPPADPEANPEVNLGTGTIDRARWGPLVDRFIKDLRSFDFLGRRLDVRENVKFKGGNFSRWIHESFPESGCSLAIEFKKFFMDEWSGKLDRGKSDAIRRALEATAPGVLEELGKLGARQE